MFWSILSIVTCIKLMLIPTYRSTDFEVHRNWLAVTHSLPMSKWYYENTSEWTLDYPPVFAYFEYLLSLVAKRVDPKMLTVENLNYASAETVLFQRLSVIFTDIIYVIGVCRCANTLNYNLSTRYTHYMVMLGNFGLMLVDHIHFQYNGIMFGILLISISYMLEEKFLKSAFFFALLLNMKHIFLYISPMYIIYLLKVYCYQNSSPFQMAVKLSKLAFITIGVTALSFGPFLNQIPQVLSRLFPFKRGLCHAYWAPNFWALYNLADKIGATVFGTSGVSSNTGGLVQEMDHQFLPNIPPLLTFVFTIMALSPLFAIFLSKPYDKETMKTDFIGGIVICASTSFIFGWHVHEKAILMTLIPMSLLLGQSKYHADLLLFLAAVANYSLLPLLFTPELIIVKYCLYALYLLVMILSYRLIQFKFEGSGMLKYEKFYLLGLLVPFAYEIGLQYLFRLDKRLPFLPLLLTSVYCSIGIMYFWLRFYLNYLGPSIFFLDEEEMNRILKKSKAKKVK